MGQIIFITGAGGFIGNHLLKRLIGNGYETVCFNRSFNQNFKKEFEGKTTMVEGDIRNLQLLINIINRFKPTYVYHLAGSKSRSNRISEFHESFEINYKGTLNLLEALLNKEYLIKIILLGTMDEYGNSSRVFSEELKEEPNSAYGLSKLSATKLALIFNKQFHLPITILRPSIVYGPEQGSEMFIPAIIHSLKKGEVFKMTAGEQLRDFIYIDDLLEALLLTKDSTNSNGEVINIGLGKSIQLFKLASQIANYNSKSELLRVGAIPYRGSEIMNYKVNIEKAKLLLNWSPKYTINRGLEETINYYIKDKEHQNGV